MSNNQRSDHVSQALAHDRPERRPFFNMENKLDIFNAFNQNREMLIAIAARKLKPCKWFDMVEIEEIVDNVFLDVAQATQAKIGFIHHEHFIKYFRVSLNKRCNIEFHKKRLIMVYPPMTDNERAKNFALARDIIDRVRE